MKLRLLQGFALLAAVVSFGLIAIRPDTERHIIQNMPGNPMPDAFNGLKGIMPVFMLFITATLLLVLWIEKKQRYVLLIPLLLGPSACFVGWCFTENFDDPNGFQLLTLTTIGMLVSCAVTTMLLVATKKTIGVPILRLP